MENPIKFLKAIKSLKSGVEFSHQGDITTEAEFNQVRWKTGVDSEGATIDTTTNPHSELRCPPSICEKHGIYNGHPGLITEYPELKEQLDLLYKDMAADKGDKTGEWFKAVKKVKDDNPKG